MQNRDREYSLLKALDQLIFWAAGVTLLLLGGAYFALPRLLDAQNEWLSFLRAIITNLIPVLLLFVFSYVAFRRIDAIRFERSGELLAYNIANTVIQQIDTGSTRKLPIESVEPQTRARTRNDITQINRQLISEADDAVVSFSGDLSWTESCHDELMAAANRSVSIQLLCKDPITVGAKRLVQKYYRQPGIQIRYYPYDFVLNARGMMIDIPSTKKAVFFKKRHKELGDNFARGSGKEGNTAVFNYWLRVCDGEDDLELVAPFAQVFSILWERASNADILEKRESDVQFIQRELRKIRQYGQAEISLRRVRVANLKPMHRIIDENEYVRVCSLAERIRWHHLDLWDVVSVLSGDTHKVICPPLIEIYEGSWIIVDGLARVHYARGLGESEIIACVVENVPEPPVGDTWNWEQVRIAKNSDYQKADNFLNLDMSRWRNLDAFHTALTLSAV
jgi:hypothetical protein